MLRTRISEHSPSSPRNGPERDDVGKSKIAIHIHDSGHNFDSNTIIKLVHEENKDKKRLALETIEIIKEKYKKFNLLNNDVPTSTLAEALYGPP